MMEMIKVLARVYLQKAKGIRYSGKRGDIMISGVMMAKSIVRTSLGSKLVKGVK